MQNRFSIAVGVRITILILFLLLLVGYGGDLLRLFALSGASVLDGTELWRLITWPLAPGLGSLVVGALAFFTPAEELEGLLGTRTFLLWLFSIVLGNGIVHMLLFPGTIPLLTGLFSISLFVVIGYIYFYPHGSVKIFFFSLRSTWLTAVVTAIWLLVIIDRSLESDELLVALSGGLLSSLVALLWFHGRYQRYDILPGVTWLLSHITGEHQTGSTARVPKWGSVSVHQRSSTRTTRGTRRERETPSPSQRADALLDKISSSGVDSLTDEERAFLDDYSRRM